MIEAAAKVMISEAVSMLDLPPLRGNPFDHRPIEPSRAQDLVGRDSLMIRLREYIISESPRNILLVGESGSGRTSMVNALSSQVRNKFVSQFWPETDPVNSILNELSVHFAGYETPRTTSRMCETLVEILDKETGPLPLIALDYPTSTPLNELLTRITPLLQRLRALVIVTATPLQLKSLDESVAEAYDIEQLDDFSKQDVQKLADNLIRRKARERWIINTQLMGAMMERTGGHPRDVVKLCRDLLDERRGNGSEGTLERLMSWSGRIDDVPEVSFEIKNEPEESVQVSEIAEIEKFREEDREFVEDSDEWDVEPDDMWEDEIEPENEPVWDETIPEIEEVRPEQEPPEPSNPPEEGQGTLDSYVEIIDATEEQSRTPVTGAFGGLLNRTVITGDEMPKEPDGKPVTVANPEPKPFVPSTSTTVVQDQEPSFQSQAIPDTSITPAEEVSVMSDEGSLWTADPSLGAVPEVSEQTVPEKTLFDLDQTPEFVENEPEPEMPIAPLTPPVIPQNHVQFGPTWEPDEPFDRSRFTYISDNERTILEAASGREVSPSDAELQAVLEVGRTRLSQIFNGLRRAGLLSVRKQGRTRLFKLSDIASAELGMN
tara:strand:+ start:9680 stop:11491 length:1812 start_codon:yes stop_codon:yes gene_type:complete